MCFAMLLSRATRPQLWPVLIARGQFRPAACVNCPSPPHCCSSPFAGPYAWQLRAERPNPPSDPSRRLQQCLEVNLYLFFTLGCALPLLYAWRMQGRRQRGAATEEATAEEAAGLPWRQVHPLPYLLLASCAAWCVSGVAGLAFH